MGGNMSMIRLNASAGEKSKRSLMEYCLGMVRDNNSPDDNDSDLHASLNRLGLMGRLVRLQSR